MTRDESNRRIAEALEPMPAEFVHDDDRLMGADNLRSPLGLWRPAWKFKREPFQWYWEPCKDFYTSEDASAMLLEAMPHPYLVRLGNEWECAADDWYRADSYIFDPNRKTAIAEAFKQWKGIQ